MTTYLGKSCSFGLPRVPFVNCRQFMYLVISLLVLRAGCGIWLYQFLIIAYLFTFQDVHSSDKLSDHDIVSGTLKIFIPPIKKPRRKVYLYQKGGYESMRKDTLEFAKEKYFNGHSDTRSVQENFDLLTSFIQESADKHIPSKTSRSVSSIPWITPEIRRKIRRRNKTHAKAKKTGSSKLRSKFETLRREIKADVRKQHDLYVNNLVGDVKANPRDFLSVQQ